MPTPEPVHAIPQGVCQPGCLRLSAYLRAKFRLADGGCFNPNSRTSSGKASYHVDGQAIDIMADARQSDQRSRGDAVFAWVIQHAEELNLQEMIWNGHIITARRWSEGVRAYPAHDHDNHVHIAVGRAASQNWRPNGTHEPEVPVPVVEREGPMATVVFDNDVHSFWIDHQGWMQHAFGGNVENMSGYAQEKVRFDPAFPIDVLAEGTVLRVRAVCASLPPPNGRRLWEWKYTKGAKVAWVPAAFVPKA